MLCDLKRFDTLSIIGTILEGVVDRILGVLSALLQVGFIFDKLFPIVGNVLSDGERRSRAEGRERFDGKNVFVLAAIAEILGVEILGRSRYETMEEKSNYRRILKTRISLGRQLLIRSTVSSSFPWTTSNLQLITFPAA